MTADGLWPVLCRDVRQHSFPDSFIGVCELLQDCAVSRAFLSKHVLARQGEHLDEIVLVREGYLMTLHRQVSGRETLVAIHGPGSIVGVGETLTDDVAHGTVVCATAVAATVVASRLFRAKTEQSHSLSHELLGLQGIMASRQQEMLLNIVSSTARERIERFLGDMARQQTGDRNHDASILLRLNGRHELAKLLHVVPETLCRVLANLESEGILRRHRDGLEVNLALLDLASRGPGPRRGRVTPATSGYR